MKIFKKILIQNCRIAFFTFNVSIVNAIVSINYQWKCEIKNYILWKKVFFSFKIKEEEIRINYKFPIELNSYLLI